MTAAWSTEFHGVRHLYERGETSRQIWATVTTPKRAPTDEAIRHLCCHQAADLR